MKRREPVVMWPELFGQFWGTVILSLIAPIHKVQPVSRCVADRIKG